VVIDNSRKEGLKTLKDGVCEICGKTYKRTDKRQRLHRCSECSHTTQRKGKAIYKDKPKTKRKNKKMKEKIPHFVNTDDDFSRQFIGRVVKI